MFARAASIFVLALPIFVLALPILAVPVDIATIQCNAGNLQCCNAVETPNCDDLTQLFGLIGVDPGTVTGFVGITCTPITVVGVSDTSCPGQAVCCTNNSFDGIIALGCTAPLGF